MRNTLHVRPTQREKAEAFRALHEGDPFVIPNPWDAGSARVLEALGFKALASTSSGFAFTLGRLDGAATLDEVAEHARPSVTRRAAVSIDLENSYGPQPRRRSRGSQSRRGQRVGGSSRLRPSGVYELGMPRTCHHRSRGGKAPDTLHAHRARREPQPRSGLTDTISRLRPSRRRARTSSCARSAHDRGDQGRVRLGRSTGERARRPRPGDGG
jgi:hypothetical protein